VIDTVVNGGESAAAFVELTLLLLPTVLAIVLPVAAFAATLYAINRLFAESEIVVMFASGTSGLELIRPVALFAAPVMALALGLTLFAQPAAEHALKTRISEVRGNIVSAFLRPGTFQLPARGITVYMRAMGRPGELLGVFVHDERDAEQTITYSAERAVILSDGDGTRLVMFDGVGQIAARADPDSLSVLRFSQLAYDLTQFTGKNRQRLRKPSEMYLPELFTIREDETGGRPLGHYRAEAHEALSGPLYAFALPLLAVAFLVSAGFRRQGFVARIVLTAGAGVALRLAGLGAKAATSGEMALWPLMYLPPLVGIAAGLWLLAGRPTPWRRGDNGGRGGTAARA